MKKTLALAGVLLIALVFLLRTLEREELPAEPSTASTSSADPPRAEPVALEAAESAAVVAEVASSHRQPVGEPSEATGAVAAEPIEGSCYAVAPGAASEATLADRVDEYLRTHYEQRIVLEDIAQHVGVSRSTLTHRYHAEVGATPIARLAEYRLDVARAMVLTKDVLFLAGPPDIIDRDDPHGAFEGRNGGLFCAVSTTDGRKIAEYPLEASPAFDGLIAARKKLFLTTTDGCLSCWE